MRKPTLKEVLTGIVDLQIDAIKTANIRHESNYHKTTMSFGEAETMHNLKVENVRDQIDELTKGE